MDIVKWVDDLIIDGLFGIQSAANIFERWGGVKYYTLSRIMTVATVAIIIQEMPERVLEDLSKGLQWPFILFFHTIGVFGVTFMALLAVGMTILARSNTDRGFQNPVRDLAMPFRIIFLTFLVVIGVIHALKGDSVEWSAIAYWFAINFASCDEAPPTHDTVPQT